MAMFTGGYVSGDIKRGIAFQRDFTAKLFQVVWWRSYLYKSFQDIRLKLEVIKTYSL